MTSAFSIWLGVTCLMLAFMIGGVAMALIVVNLLRLRKLEVRNLSAARKKLQAAFHGVVLADDGAIKDAKLCVYGPDGDGKVLFDGRFTREQTIALSQYLEALPAKLWEKPPSR